MRFVFRMVNANGIIARLELRLDEFHPRYNIAPSQSVPVVFNDHRQDLLDARWGMPVHWSNEGGSKPMMNARSESIMEKSMFKKHFEEQRCLMLSDGFYEWKHSSKTPYLIQLKDRASFAYAGIFAEKEGNRSCCMITCGPNDVVRPIHDRMPVIIEAGREKEYLEATPQEARQILKPLPSELMEAYEVSRKINGARTDTPDLIEPAKKEKTLFDY